METKVCKKCELELDISNFYRNSTYKDGYSSKCKKCQRIADKRKYEANKEKYQKYGRDYYYRRKENANKEIKHSSTESELYMLLHCCWYDDNLGEWCDNRYSIKIR